MGGKYSVLARNYKDKAWPVALCTNSRFKAYIARLKALRKYEMVEFKIRK